MTTRRGPIDDKAVRVCKVLLAGPVGVGKTTAVTSVSDVDVLTTETRPSDATRHVKASTTVALDFGVARLDASRVLHLYGTPGQQRFDFMWEILLDGCVGVLLFVDASDPDADDGLDPYLAAFGGMLGERRLALGVTRLPPGVHDGLARYRSRLGEAGTVVPVMEVDPRSRSDVLILARALLATAERSSPA